jgi:hypothetical protein
MTDPLVINPNNPEISVLNKMHGDNLIHAPQPALTVTSGGGLSSGGPANLGSGDSGILSNTITRVNQIEAALIKLGLLRHP